MTRPTSSTDYFVPSAARSEVEGRFAGVADSAIGDVGAIFVDVGPKTFALPLCDPELAAAFATVRVTKGEHLLVRFVSSGDEHGYSRIRWEVET